VKRQEKTGEIHKLSNVCCCFDCFVRCRTGTLRPFDGIRNLKKIKAKKDPKYFAICRVVCWFVPTDHGDRVFLLMLFGWKWMLILTMNCPFKIILNIPVTSLERYLDVGKICNRHLKKKRRIVPSFVASITSPQHRWFPTTR
jgi:hypothetical protein